MSESVLSDEIPEKRRPEQDYRRRDFFAGAEDLRRACLDCFFAESRYGAEVFAAVAFDSEDLARRAAAQPRLFT